MAKDPAFLFYPGDYLRDTQNLSEKSQVAYDRIMCEHMRNICEDMSNIIVSKKQVNFFSKRLNDEEKEELLFVLTKIGESYQIEWVAESIAKRKLYSNSRSKNRERKNKKDMKTYVPHMENENENENVIKNTDKIKEKFEVFRKKYPGTKRGLETEFENLKKKHKSYKNICDILLANLDRQIEERSKISGFIPEWPHLKTYINQSSWETEYKSNKQSKGINSIWEKQ